MSRTSATSPSRATAAASGAASAPSDAPAPAGEAATPAEPTAPLKPPGPGAPPRERGFRADALRNRGKLLEAARELFADQGLEAPVEEIARRAEVGIGTFYRHFPTKQDLLAALIEDRFAGLAEAAREALDDPDAERAFATFMRRAARVMVEDRGVSEAMDQQPEICDAAASRAELVELSSEILARAQAAGVARPDLTQEDLPNLLCGLGRATRARAGALQNWERYVEIMLAGLRPPPA